MAGTAQKYFRSELDRGVDAARRNYFSTDGPDGGVVTLSNSAAWIIWPWVWTWLEHYSGRALRASLQASFALLARA
jgi:hypothetical protein